jgi:calcium-dependent protein kinase
MYILLSGEPPFNGDNDTEILIKVKKGEYDFNSPAWETISEDAKCLINRLLEFDPKYRIKANEALKHVWFKRQLKMKVGLKESQCLTKTLQDLGTFRIALKMQQAALTYMANHLIKEDELKQLNKAFKALDADDNGKLSKEELIQGYNKIKNCKLNQKELEEIFEAADADNSGEIDYSEWVLAAANKTKLLSKENLM